jgi:hypothetical protein
VFAYLIIVFTVIYVMVYALGPGKGPPQAAHGQLTVSNSLATVQQIMYVACKLHGC